MSDTAITVSVKRDWDSDGQRWLENGTRHAMLYTPDDTATVGTTDEAISKKKYGTASVWNGVTAVTETPGGAEANDVYADDIKYATLRSAETFGGTIEAFTFPDEWYKCDGSYVDSIANGVMIGQQLRTTFGFSFESQVFNDTNTPEDDDVKIHLWYGCSASPSDRSYATINDSPEGISFSWEISTIPTSIEGKSIGNVARKAISTITIQKNKTHPETVDNKTVYTRFEALEAILYGYTYTPSGGTATTVKGRLPMPKEVYNLFAYGYTGGTDSEITINTHG